MSKEFVKNDTVITESIKGFDYAVFVIGRFGFMIGIIIQVVGGVILLRDRKNR
ncbi:MAG: hypothetical protein HZA82_03345 [Thaumarchaeota archaeon]|nr:hypothetical protein [Nitrososphaerota archaeon]